MCEERWGSVAEAFTEIEPDGGRPQTAKEAKELWSNTLRTNPLEAARMRHCAGCQWLKSCGGYLCCSYLIDTESRRPCPPGPCCVVKQTPPGWRYPKGYAGWCAELDKQHGKGAVKLTPKTQSFQRMYARQLHDLRYHTWDIAEIVGMKPDFLRSLIARENWKGGQRWRVKTRRDGFAIAREKEHYQQAKAEWEKANGIRSSDDDENGTE